jgi:hypothetical protein
MRIRREEGRNADGEDGEICSGDQTGHETKALRRGVRALHAGEEGERH